MQQLLLLHGALGSPKYFNFIQSALDSKFEIHAPAFDGHSGTIKKTENLTIDYYVQQIADYCDTHQLNEIFILGYSMGGYIALAFARKYPQRVIKIMTLATKYYWNPEIAQNETAFLNPKLILEKVPKYANLLQEWHGESQWQMLVNDIASLIQNLGHNPTLNENNLKEISCKVQVMVGDKDNMVSIEESKQLANAIPLSNFAVLPNTIHPFEKISQKLLLQMIEDFFVSE